MGLDDMRKMLAPFKTKVFNMIARAVVKLVDDKSLLQQLQLEVLDGEVLDDCPRFQQYGFTSHPFAGTEAIVLFLNGDRSQPVVIALDDMGSRPADFEEGEVGLYTDEDNSDTPDDKDARFFHKLARGKIHKLWGAEIHLGGDDQGVVIDGKLKSYIDAEIKTKFNAHTHVCAAPGGTSGPPAVTIASAGDIVSPKAKASQ